MNCIELIPCPEDGIPTLFKCCKCPHASKLTAKYLPDVYLCRKYNVVDQCLQTAAEKKHIKKVLATKFIKKGDAYAHI